MPMKNSTDTIRNRTRDLPVGSTVPQPTAPPLPKFQVPAAISWWVMAATERQTDRQVDRHTDRLLSAWCLMFMQFILSCLRLLFSVHVENSGNVNEQNCHVYLPKRADCIPLLYAYCMELFFWILPSLQHAYSQWSCNIQVSLGSYNA
jgi:hypothetical protein